MNEVELYLRECFALAQWEEGLHQSGSSSSALNKNSSTADLSSIEKEKKKASDAFSICMAASQHQEGSRLSGFERNITLSNILQSHHQGTGWMFALQQWQSMVEENTANVVGHNTILRILSLNPDHYHLVPIFYKKYRQEFEPTLATANVLSKHVAKHSDAQLAEDVLADPVMTRHLHLSVAEPAVLRLFEAMLYRGRWEKAVEWLLSDANTTGEEHNSSNMVSSSSEEKIVPPNRNDNFLVNSRLAVLIAQYFAKKSMTLPNSDIIFDQLFHRFGVEYRADTLAAEIQCLCLTNQWRKAVDIFQRFTWKDKRFDFHSAKKQLLRRSSNVPAAIRARIYHL